ncbi:MAG: response regulator [Syntrophorhabdales bacterium]
MEKKVLLIDDEASLRRSVSIGLMQKGYQTEPCENGMKALQTLETFKKKRIPLDCAIVDIKLPDIDGLKLLKVIKFTYPQLPVIIITGYGSETVAEEARTADAYLEKPFTMEDLAKVLEEMEPPKAEEVPVEAPPTEPAAAGQSASAYVLVSVDNAQKLLNTYRKLYFHQNVLYCDAIRGDYDLILLLQAPTFDDINEVMEKDLKTMDGVTEVSLLSVDTPTFGENVINIMGSVDRALGRDKGENTVAVTQTPRTRVSSYVMLEVEKEKMEAIYPTLYFNDQVVNCDCTNGMFNVVLLMKGTSFSEIENMIRNKFKTIDGVLRIKEYPIITLFEA